MTDRDKIEELMARLEKAQGPDLELDAEIYCLIRGFEKGPYEWHEAPYYSESIDAAMTLVPEGYSFDVVMQPWRSSTPKCSANVWSGLSFNAMAETPAIALCIAALKAIAAGDKQ